MAGGDGSGEFVAGFIVGALAGAAIALLFAPVTGDEMRSQLRERGIELKDRAGILPSRRARERRLSGLEESPC